MKVKILPLIGFILGLSLAIISLLALFGESGSLSLIYWLRDKLALLILCGIGCTIVYYLTPFVIDFTDEEE